MKPLVELGRFYHGEANKWYIAVAPMFSDCKGGDKQLAYLNKCQEIVQERYEEHKKYDEGRGGQCTCESCKAVSSLTEPERVKIKDAYINNVLNKFEEWANRPCRVDGVDTRDDCACFTCVCRRIVTGGEA